MRFEKKSRGRSNLEPKDKLDRLDVEVLYVNDRGVTRFPRVIGLTIAGKCL